MKTETFSDYFRRPISRECIKYAAFDAWILIPIVYKRFYSLESGYFNEDFYNKVNEWFQ